MNNQRPFTFWLMLRLSSFQIGSAMGEIFIGSIWNRVLISTFHIPSTPVSLLIALGYLLLPVSLWAGARSDSHPLWGYRRTGYVWLGRGLMLLALPFFGLSLHFLGQSPSSVLGWLTAVIAAVAYAVGRLASGSPYLALVRDAAPKEKQGLAISTAETVLISFLAVFGIAFSLALKDYSEGAVWQILLVTAVVGGFFWWFSIQGSEIRGATPAQKESRAIDFRATFQKIWLDPRTRTFFLFLALSTAAAWMQEVVLEPFGAEVLHMDYAHTTRLSSYWQTATLLTLIIGAYAWRKRRPEQQNNITRWGLIFMGLGALSFTATSLLGERHLLELALMIFGGGFGVYTFGAFSLMAAMSSDKEAGAYLGLWTIAILLFKGVGTFSGGVFRDLFLLGLSPSMAYGAIFAVQAAGLFVSAVLLMRVDVISFVNEIGQTATLTDVQIANAD